MKNTVRLLLTLAFAASIGFAVPEWVPGRALLIKRKYESWHDVNRKSIDVAFEKSAIVSGVDKEAEKLFGPTAHIALTGHIENRSADKISCVVVDYKVLHSQSGAVLVTKRLAVQLEVFPGAKREFDDWFDASGEDGRAPLHELYRASQQAGGKFTWTQEIVVVVPEKLEDSLDLLEVMKVDAYVSVRKERER